MMFSRETKRRIMDRCDGLCERWLPEGRRCLAPVVDIHHIVPRAMGGRKGVWHELINDEKNGMGVCRTCHEMAAFWTEDDSRLVPGPDFRAALRRGELADCLVLASNKGV